MAKRPKTGHSVKNKHGNVSVPLIDVGKLGSPEFPLVVYRGTKDEDGVWFAKIQPLPGYLGWGTTEAKAIAGLWEMIGSGPVYDIRGAHNIEPTPANIRKALDHAKKVDAARVAISAGLSEKDERLAALAKESQLARHSIKRAMTMNEMWRNLGGIDQYVAGLSFADDGYIQNAKKCGHDPQAYFENNPERARFFLARLKFPPRGTVPPQGCLEFQEK